MFRSLSFLSNTLLVFYISLAVSVTAADEGSTQLKIGYTKGDSVPVSCLNRTIETGEHITDSHGNLQYIPFMVCNETNAPLSFSYGQPKTQNCTIETLSDELYHLLEYFVHSDVPLSCRVPSYPLSSENAFASTMSDSIDNSANYHEKWTPFTIALQGTLQLSHLHIHTHINALFHTASDEDTVPEYLKEKRKTAGKETSHLIGTAAYSLPAPNTLANPSLNLEGTKIVRNEPLVLTFNVGWIEGAVLPGMVGKPVMKLTDHNVGFTLLSFFAIAASAGVGAMLMLVYDRRKSGRAGYGVLPMASNGAAVRNQTGYGGYGGYSTSSIGKRD